MSSTTTARLSVGVVTSLTLFVTASLFFHSLRHPGLEIAEKIDLWTALFGASMILIWMGVGIWMGAVAFVVSLGLVGLASFMGLVSFWILFGVLAAFAFFSHRTSSGMQSLFSQHSAIAEEWEEKSNDLNEELRQHQAQKTALEHKINRYETLKEFTNQLSSNLSLQDVIDKTLTQASRMLPGDELTCLLYLVDRQQQVLSLQRSLRSGNRPIKHKKGDLLDYLVLKQRQSLIVEDVRKDFRFNIDEQNPEFQRAFRSLIAVPLLDEKGIIGVLRIDSPIPGRFAQEDLRVLAIIADLATTAIRNATLFAVTQDLAIKDGLTGLYVYRYLNERLQEEIQRAFRSGSSLSLALMDIDWFKKYNDRFGHISGDLVLKQLGRRLSDSAKAGEMVARYGGEEFALVLPNNDAKAAFERTEKIRRVVEADIFWLRQQPTRVTISAGIATFPTQAKDREELIRLADQALYKAKEGGRNRTCSLLLS